MIKRLASSIVAAGAWWWLAVALLASFGMLGTFTYRAMNEWRRSASLLAEQRAQQGADLLAVTLTRDMRGAQALLLSSTAPSGDVGPERSELSRVLAGTFARFSYPEVFFSWTSDVPVKSVQFFARRDRTPSWIDAPPQDLFPVMVASGPTVAVRLLERMGRDGAQQRRFSIFDLDIGGRTYQVIGRLHYRDPVQQRLQAIFGFMVDMGWVRQHYFSEIVKQVTPLAGPDVPLTFTITPPRQHRSDAPTTSFPAGRRTVVMAFFDPLLVAIDRPSDLQLDTWTVEAMAAHDPVLQDALVGARRMVIVTLLAAVLFSVGLGLSLRAIRAHAAVAKLRTDFVSTVTHELKTPIATIRAAGDTLVSHRVDINDRSRRYAQIVIEESKRLTRLLDNLLAYARITDTTEAYSFRSLSVEAISREIVRHSQTRLDTGGFDVRVDIPPDLPPVRADWTAICLALDNVLDNAIRYSKDRRVVRISAIAVNGTVRIDIGDRGVGIAPEDLAHVTQRFFRGQLDGLSGSGLGLAIADRIVADHGGFLAIASTLGAGTTVSVTLARADAGS